MRSSNQEIVSKRTSARLFKFLTGKGQVSGVVQGERRGDMSGSNLKLCSAGRVDKKERERI